MSARYDRTKVKLIVIHHFASGVGPISDPSEAKRIANPNGYEFGEYDFIVLANGSVITDRPLDVIGAHTQCDRPQYNRGENWWNKNSASIAMAIDNSRKDASGQYIAPPAAMVEGLARFLVKWFKDTGATLDDVYPHFQVTQTDCPGASYSKLGLNTGGFNYDGLESWVKKLVAEPSIPPINSINISSVPIPLSAKCPLVVFFTLEDIMNAQHVAEKVGGVTCSRFMYERVKSYPWGQIYSVGGPDIPGAKNLSGYDWIDTGEEVFKFMRG